MKTSVKSFVWAIASLSFLGFATQSLADKPIYVGKASTGEPVYFSGARFQLGITDAMKLKQILIAGMVFAGVCGGAIPPAQSKQPLRRTFVSDSGLTTIQIVQAGAWDHAGVKIGTYHQQGGSGGYLLNAGQDDPMGFYTRFHDTSGHDRCVGRMHLYVDDSGRQYNSRATWIVDGAVPGYSCSTMGKTFKLRMQQM